MRNELEEFMMAIKLVRVVSVFVSDQDRALDFYTNALGFELRMDVPYGEGYRWVEVAPKGAETAIALVKPYPGQPGGQIGGLTSFVLSTDDIAATYEELRGRGVEFVEPPAMQSWGMMQAILADLDGNQSMMVQY
jgi:lactoylglutathione lyase